MKLRTIIVNEETTPSPSTASRQQDDQKKSEFDQASASPSFESDASNIRRLDRLATGDLTEIERRELLDWLDAHPAQWRLCAMTFLEAQALREAFGLALGMPTAQRKPAAQPKPSMVDISFGRNQLSHSDGISPVVCRPEPNLGSEFVRWRITPLVYQIAILMVAFSLGWMSAIRNEVPVQVQIDKDGLGVQVVHLGQTVRREFVPQNSVPNTIKRPVVVDAQREPARQREPVQSDPDRKIKEIGSAAANQSLASDATAAGILANCEFTLPILSSELPEEHWARHTTIPQYVKSHWGSRGYQVSEDRRFVPVLMADGRRVDVPINHVKLKFVGTQPL